MMRGAIWAIIAVVWSGLIGVAQAETADKVFESVSKSTVVIFAYDGKGKVAGFGSGVVLPDGSVATNCHVLEKADSLRVGYQDQKYPATRKHSDRDRDTCTLVAAGLKAPPVTLGTTKNLKVGARVYAVGAPQGLTLTLSEGIVSSLRPVDGGQYIQTTTPISPGSSGGGLFDANGRLLGLTSFYMAEGQNLNFALPVEWINELPKRQATQKKKSQAAAGKTTVEWLNQAVVLEEKEDWPGLVRHTLSWTKAVPKNAEAWFGLGLAYRQSGKPDKAIEAYQQALRINPEDAEAWSNLGVVYGKTGKPDKEIEAYQQALRINPELANAWYNLGVVYGKTGKPDKAIDSFQQALRINPEHANAWYGLGVVYGETGKPDKAIEAYQQALRINPELANAWYSLGVAYRQSGKPDKAIEAHQQALRINPEDAEAWSSLGVVYGKTGKPDKAIDSFQQALRINPEHVNAWYGLGIAYRASGQTGKVMEVYRRLQKIDRDMADKFFNKIVLP